MSEHALDALLHETRRFDPPADLAADANATESTYADAATDRLGWWEEQARTLTWAKPWEQVLEWTLPFAKWFVGGELNACVNAVDRHVDAGAGDKVAFHWIGDGERDRRDITYADLKREVCKAANGLTSDVDADIAETAELRATSDRLARESEVAATRAQLSRSTGSAADVVVEGALEPLRLPEAGVSLDAEQRHALCCAGIARGIATDPVQADYAFLAGMLHDVGKLVWASCSPNRHPSTPTW